MSDLPTSTQVLVVGGGPAGATAATLLAREGFDVTLVEKAVGPRYHIGESLLPTALEIFDLLGIREKIEATGFQRKAGGYFETGERKWGIDFGKTKGTYSLQVQRSEFDKLLLDHANSQGVKVFEGIEVSKLSFDGERPRSATWLQSSERSSGELSFDFLIDASGRSGLMATRYLQNREYHQEFQNIAIWGYWKNADVEKIRPAGGTASIFTLDDSGWFWAIPLSDGTLSLGLVLKKEIYKTKRSAKLEELYLSAIADSPYITDLVASAELVSPVKVEQDYSYSAKSFCGSGYFLLGDAACFLDPLLSTGVHLATFSGKYAAASIASVLRNEVTENQALSFYDQSFRFHYLTLLVFVASLYYQPRSLEDLPPNPEVGPAQFIMAMPDLAKVEESMRNLVTQHTVSLMAKAQEGIRILIAEEMKGQACVREKDEDVFLEIWNGMFDSIPHIDGLHLTTQPRLGLASVSECSATVARTEKHLALVE